MLNLKRQHFMDLSMRYFKSIFSVGLATLLVACGGGGDAAGGGGGGWTSNGGAGGGTGGGGTNRIGGGGGGSSAISKGFFNANVLPDILYIQVGPGGLGGATGVDHLAHISGFLSGLIFVIAGLPFLAMTFRDEYREYERQIMLHRKRQIDGSYLV